MLYFLTIVRREMTALASVANAADPIQYLRTHPHLIIEAASTNSNGGGAGTSNIGETLSMNFYQSLIEFIQGGTISLLNAAKGTCFVSLFGFGFGVLRVGMTHLGPRIPT